MNTLSNTQTEQILRDKLADLDVQLASLEERPDDQGSISFGKRVGEGTSMAVDRLSQVAAHEKMHHTRAEVERALVKLESGSYGKCDVCEQPIGEGRLEVMPWAVRCVEDAAKAGA